MYEATINWDSSQKVLKMKNSSGKRLKRGSKKIRGSMVKKKRKGWVEVNPSKSVKSGQREKTP